MTYEYKVVTLDPGKFKRRSDTAIEQVLNAMAAEGWRAMPVQLGWTFFFEREVRVTEASTSGP